MTISFSVAATSNEAQDEDVLIDVHHIFNDGEWLQHRSRSYRLPIGKHLELVAHAGLGFKLHRGQREMLCVTVSHNQPSTFFALELVSVVTTAPTNDAVGCDVVTVPPGERVTLNLAQANVLVIREVPMEVRRG